MSGDLNVNIVWICFSTGFMAYLNNFLYKDLLSMVHGQDEMHARITCVVFYYKYC